MPDLLALSAYFVAFIHFLFVAHVLLGGIPLLWRPRLFPLHLPFFLYAIIIEAIRFPCPLTYLEKTLRYLANLPNYSGGFLGHYVEPHLQAAGLPPLLYQNMGYATVALNLLLYTHLLHRHLRPPLPPQPHPPPHETTNPPPSPHI